MKKLSKILGLAIMAIFSAQVAFAEPKIFTEKEIQILSNMSEQEVLRYEESRFIDLLKDCNKFNEGYRGDKTDYQVLFDAVIAHDYKKKHKSYFALNLRPNMLKHSVNLCRANNVPFMMESLVAFLGRLTHH